MSDKERFEGPTKEHMRQDDVHFDTGDDQQGNKRWTRLTRLEVAYNTWMVRAGTRDHRELTAQLNALTELDRAYKAGGLMGNVGSVDCNRTYTPSAAGRSGLARNEYQLDDRNTIYSVQQELTHHEWIVVSNVVFNDNTLIMAGYAIGASSRASAHRLAGNILRDAGVVTARMLGY